MKGSTRIIIGKWVRRELGKDEGEEEEDADDDEDVDKEEEEKEEEEEEETKDQSMSKTSTYISLDCSDCWLAVITFHQMYRSMSH